MRLKRQVVMLPTNEKANGVIVIDSFRTIKPNMFIVTNNNCQHEDYIPQHLYILSDEDIKKGDWAIEFYLDWAPKEVFQCKGIIPSECLVKKIIATTNTLEVQLINSQDGSKSYISQLPKPSESFIGKFVEEYNKDNQITEVLVEYYFEPFSGIAQLPPKLKVSKDNTITIHKVKDNYSRAEVIQLIDNLYEQGGFDDYLDELLDKNNVIKEVSFSESDAGKKWIEENL